jgi:hypothetical protein
VPIPVGIESPSRNGLQLVGGEAFVATSLFDPTSVQRQSVEEAFRQLFENPPKLHRPMDFHPDDDPTAEDGRVDWGIQPSFLRLLMKTVNSDSLTLETGSGLSTVCLAIVGAQHICISPLAKEHDRIRRYCNEHHISTDRIRFIPARSHAVLPTLDIGEGKLDFALIDGSHTFPEGIVDYYYVNEHLKVGGLLAIDDLSISSVGILHKFLITDPAYELVTIDGLKTGVYRKVAETFYPRGWSDQLFNAKYPDFSYLPRPTRIRNRLQAFESKVRPVLRKIPGLRGSYRTIRDWSKKVR